MKRFFAILITGFLTLFLLTPMKINGSTYDGGEPDEVLNSTEAIATSFPTADSSTYATQISTSAATRIEPITIDTKTNETTTIGEVDPPKTTVWTLGDAVSTRRTSIPSYSITTTADHATVETGTVIGTSRVSENSGETSTFVSGISTNFEATSLGSSENFSFFSGETTTTTSEIKQETNTNIERNTGLRAEESIIYEEIARTSTNATRINEDRIVTGTSNSLFNGGTTTTRSSITTEGKISTTGIDNPANTSDNDRPQEAAVAAIIGLWLLCRMRERDRY